MSDNNNDKGKGNGNRASTSQNTAMCKFRQALTAKKRTTVVASTPAQAAAATAATPALAVAPAVAAVTTAAVTMTATPASTARTATAPTALAPAPAAAAIVTAVPATKTTMTTRQRVATTPVERRSSNRRTAVAAAAVVALATTTTTATHTGRRYYAAKAGVERRYYKSRHRTRPLDKAAAAPVERRSNRRTTTAAGRHAAPTNDDSSIHNKIQDEVRQKMAQHVQSGTPWPEVPPRSTGTTEEDSAVPTGVSKIKRGSGLFSYIVRIRCQKKRHYIGAWPCPASAGQAYLYATAAARAFVPAEAAEAAGSDLMRGLHWSTMEQTQFRAALQASHNTQCDLDPATRNMKEYFDWIANKYVPSRTPSGVLSYYHRYKRDHCSGGGLKKGKTKPKIGRIHKNRSTRKTTSSSSSRGTETVATKKGNGNDARYHYRQYQQELKLNRLKVNSSNNKTLGEEQEVTSVEQEKEKGNDARHYYRQYQQELRWNPLKVNNTNTVVENNEKATPKRSWSEREHDQFVQALTASANLDCDCEMIDLDHYFEWIATEYVPTRTSHSIRAYFHRYKKYRHKNGTSAEAFRKAKFGRAESTLENVPIHTHYRQYQPEWNVTHNKGTWSRTEDEQLAQGLKVVMDDNDAENRKNTTEAVMMERYQILAAQYVPTRTPEQIRLHCVRTKLLSNNNNNNSNGNSNSTVLKLQEKATDICGSTGSNGDEVRTIAPTTSPRKDEDDDDDDDDDDNTKTSATDSIRSPNGIPKELATDCGEASYWSLPDNEDGNNTTKGVRTSRRRTTPTASSESSSMDESKSSTNNKKHARRIHSKGSTSTNIKSTNLNLKHDLFAASRSNKNNTTLKHDLFAGLDTNKCSTEKTDTNNDRKRNSTGRLKLQSRPQLWVRPQNTTTANATSTMESVSTARTSNNNDDDNCMEDNYDETSDNVPSSPISVPSGDGVGDTSVSRKKKLKTNNDDENAPDHRYGTGAVAPNINDEWDEVYKHLKEFHQKHGHCNVTHSSDKFVAVGPNDMISLFCWVQIQHRRMQPERNIKEHDVNEGPIADGHHAPLLSLREEKLLNDLNFNPSYKKVVNLFNNYRGRRFARRFTVLQDDGRETNKVYFGTVGRITNLSRNFVGITFDDGENVDVQKTDLFAGLILYERHKRKDVNTNRPSSPSRSRSKSRSRPADDSASNSDDDSSDGDDDIGYHPSRSRLKSRSRPADNSASNSDADNRRKWTKKKWTSEEIQRLRKCIKQFGNEYTAAYKLFPDRTERAVSQKYKKEKICLENGPDDDISLQDADDDSSDRSHKNDELSTNEENQVPKRKRGSTNIKYKEFSENDDDNNASEDEFLLNHHAAAGESEDITDVDDENDDDDFRDNLTDDSCGSSQTKIDNNGENADRSNVNNHGSRRRGINSTRHSSRVTNYVDSSVTSSPLRSPRRTSSRKKKKARTDDTFYYGDDAYGGDDDDINKHNAFITSDTNIAASVAIASGKSDEDYCDSSDDEAIINKMAILQESDMKSNMEESKNGTICHSTGISSTSTKNSKNDNRSYAQSSQSRDSFTNTLPSESANTFTVQQAAQQAVQRAATTRTNAVTELIGDYKPVQYWTIDDEMGLLYGIRKFGVSRSNWRKISNHVLPSRSVSQIKNKWARVKRNYTYGDAYPNYSKLDQYIQDHNPSWVTGEHQRQHRSTSSSTQRKPIATTTTTTTTTMTIGNDRHNEQQYQRQQEHHSSDARNQDNDITVTVNTGTNTVDVKTSMRTTQVDRGNDAIIQQPSTHRHRSVSTQPGESLDSASTQCEIVQALRQSRENSIHYNDRIANVTRITANNYNTPVGYNTNYVPTTFNNYHNPRVTSHVPPTNALINYNNTVSRMNYAPMSTNYHNYHVGSMNITPAAQFNSNTPRPYVPLLHQPPVTLAPMAAAQQNVRVLPQNYRAVPQSSASMLSSPPASSLLASRPSPSLSQLDLMKEIEEEAAKAWADADL